jgi:hypothetical protein
MTPTEVIKTPVHEFENLYKCNVRVDRFILAECFIKVSESKKRDFAAHAAPNGYQISSFKMGGIICFWLRKLKPFQVLDDSAVNRFVNEAIAFYPGYYFVCGCNSKKPKNFTPPKVTATFIHDFIQSLRYNSHSPNSSAFVFESLCHSCA